MVVGEFNIFLWYLNLRTTESTNHLFISRRNGKFINIPISINTVINKPKVVTTFLKLPESDKYTSHCIRRIATIYVDNSTTESDLMRFRE